MTINMRGLRMYKKHSLLIMLALCAMTTAQTGAAFLYRPTGAFVASLGPFFASWFIFFSMKRRILRNGGKEE